MLDVGQAASLPGTWGKLPACRVLRILRHYEIPKLAASATGSFGLGLNDMRFGTCGPRGLARLDRLVEVGNQVADILDSDRKAH